MILSAAKALAASISISANVQGYCWSVTGPANFVGCNDASANVPEGTYSVSLTSTPSGYSFSGLSGSSNPAQAGNISWIGTFTANPPLPTVNFTASPLTIPYGGTTTFTLATTNATSCTGTGAIWNAPLGQTSGTLTTGPQYTNFSQGVYCDGPGGRTTAPNINITVGAAPPPVVNSFTASPSSIPYGGSSTLSWSSSNATSCSSSGVTAGPSGSIAVGPLYITTTYNITCSGAGGTSASVPVTVTVGTPIPTLNNVTISSQTVIADNATEYNIVVNGSNPSGGVNITHEYALINYQGSNAGQYRGFLAWYYDTNYTGWNGQQDKQTCAGGGVAAVIMDYGYQYIHMNSCITSISGDIRITTFKVRFDRSFTTPTTNNDISGLVQNTVGNYVGWINFDDINFRLALPPTINDVTISSKIVKTDGTPYDIVVTGSDPAGASNISHEYALINKNKDEASFRGFLTWYYDSTYTGWPGYVGCNGPGVAAVQPYYGNTYIVLDSCSSTISGPGNTIRTVTFRVHFNSSFTTPVTNNDISGLVYSREVVNSGWKNFDTDFRLALPPTVALTCPASVPYNTSARINWTSSNASNCTLAPGGASGKNGSYDTPNLTFSTTYTIDCR